MYTFSFPNASRCTISHVFWAYFGSMCGFVFVEL